MPCIRQYAMLSIWSLTGADRFMHARGLRTPENEVVHEEGRSQSVAILGHEILEIPIARICESLVSPPAALLWCLCQAFPSYQLATTEMTRKEFVSKIS